jgi:hypothetical protein
MWHRKKSTVSAALLLKEFMRLAFRVADEIIHRLLLKNLEDGNSRRWLKARQARAKASHGPVKVKEAGR